MVTRDITLHTTKITEDTFEKLEIIFANTGYRSESGCSDCANTCAGCSGCGGTCSGSCDGSCTGNFGW